MKAIRSIALPALIGCLLAAPLPGQSLPCSTSAGTNCFAPIPDLGATPSPVVLESVINVVASGTCVGNPLTSVAAQVHVLHDWSEEVGIELVGPGGSEVLKVAMPGSSFPVEDVDQLFAAPSLTGGSPTGSWRLRLTDVDHSGYGALDDWTLELACAVPPVIPVVTLLVSIPIANEVPLTAGEMILTRSEVTASPLIVQLTIGGSATSGADFVPISLTATIPANQPSVTLLVVPIDDGVVELPETVVVTIAPGGTTYDVGMASSATVTILSPATTAEIPTLSPLALLLLAVVLAAIGGILVRRRRA